MRRQAAREAARLRDLAALVEDVAEKRSDLPPGRETKLRQQAGRLRELASETEAAGRPDRAEEAEAAPRMDGEGELPF